MPAGQSPGTGRYSGTVGDIGADELDLLECLLRIDLRQGLDERASGLATRIVAAGLANEGADGLSLTHAGVERCKSLQHRLASDQEAARVLLRRGVPRFALRGPPADRT